MQLNMPVKKWFIHLLLFISISGFSQQNPDSISFFFPDTSLSIEKSLSLIEKATGKYFSYNSANLPTEMILEISPGPWRLGDFAGWFSERNGLAFTMIGNQIVFHLPGEKPGINEEALPEEKGRKPPALLSIEGQVFGGPSEESLPFSTIWVPETWTGTVANGEGKFRLNIPEGIDSISVSFMGYRTRTLHVENLIGTWNAIHLTPLIIPIQEVVIRRTEPVSLIRQAVEKIPENYFRVPVIETAFYREHIQRNERYVNVSEAVLNIYKPGVNMAGTNQVRVLKGRRNLDLRKTDTVLVKLQAGLQTSFLLDFARNLPEFLDPEYFDDFQYHMSDIITVQEKPAYVIDFKEKPRSPYPHYLGRLYIDLETLAFRGVEFEINPETISKSAANMVVRKPRNLNVKPISASYQAMYKTDGDRFYLSLVRADTRFRIRERRKLFGAEYRTVSEMAITGLETRDVDRFRPRETASITDVFADLIGGAGQDYWEQHNILIPEVSIEDAIRRFNAGTAENPVPELP